MPEEHNGHAVGDLVLADFAERLRACVRTEDVVGRIGGDEFVVLWPGVADRDQLVMLVERLYDDLHVHIEVTIGGASIPVRASIGATLAAGHGDAQRALAEADAAMYVAKGSNKAEPALFDFGSMQATPGLLRHSSGFENGDNGSDG